MSPETCPICGSLSETFLDGSVNSEDFFTKSEPYRIAAGEAKEQLPVRRCQRCGHGFSSAGVEEGVIAEWYARAEKDEAFLAGSSGRRKTARLVLDRIEEKIAPAGEIIDVGCGPGFFLDEAQARGWSVKGVEVASWAAGYAHVELGLNVVHGDFRRLRTWPQASANVVTAFDVIEHLVSPTELLAASSHVLKAGGYLVLTTPWFDSPLARVMGRSWYCIFPAHLHYFTRQSLTELLAAEGFAVVTVRRHTRCLGAQYVWSRLRNQLGWDTGKAVRTSPEVVIPVNLGDEFEVYAQKK